MFKWVSIMRRLKFYVFLILFVKSVLAFSQDSIQTPSVSKVWFKSKSFKIMAVPSAFILSGLYTYGNHGFYSSQVAQYDIHSNFPEFQTSLDSYTQFAPAFTVFGLNAVGVKGKNPSLDVACLYLSSLVATTGMVQILKHSVIEMRPDGSANNSFPSGHTATAFVAAELLHQEFKHKSVWYSVAGYSMAILTGGLRMMNDRHWMSDVLVGAGIGVLSVKLSYGVYPYLIKSERKSKEKKL